MFDWLFEYHLLTPLLVMVAALITLLGGTLYLVHAERDLRVHAGSHRAESARLGGMFQPIADGLKIFLKEDIIPKHVDKLFSCRRRGSRLEPP